MRSFSFRQCLVEYLSRYSGIRCCGATNELVRAAARQIIGGSLWHRVFSIILLVAPILEERLCFSRFVRR